MTNMRKGGAIAACLVLGLAVLTPLDAQAQGRGRHGGAWRGGGWQNGGRHAGAWQGQRWHGSYRNGAYRNGRYWNGRSWNGGWVGPAAAGIIGGLALGALANSAYGYAPAYSPYPGGCYLKNRATYDAWGRFIGYQPVQVCY